MLKRFSVVFILTFNFTTIKAESNTQLIAVI